jgi:hypothetical protein
MDDEDGLSLPLSAEERDSMLAANGLTKDDDAVEGADAPEEPHLVPAEDDPAAGGGGDEPTKPAAAERDMFGFRRRGANPAAPVEKPRRSIVRAAMRFAWERDDDANDAGKGTPQHGAGEVATGDAVAPPATARTADAKPAAVAVVVVEKQPAFRTLKRVWRPTM